jgi:hypothetical protein
MTMKMKLNRPNPLSRSHAITSIRMQYSLFNVSKYLIKYEIFNSGDLMLPYITMFLLWLHVTCKRIFGDIYIDVLLLI